MYNCNIIIYVLLKNNDIIKCRVSCTLFFCWFLSCGEVNAMEKGIGKTIRFVEWAGIILLVLSLLYFVIGELTSKKETYFKVGQGEAYNDGWEMVLEDGTRTPAVVPGSYDVERGDVLALEKQIDVNFKGAWLCIRSSQHDIKIYVDGELRKDYNTKNTRKFGKNSVSVFVFVELLPEDAGKTIRLELVSNSIYSGYVNEIFCGNREQIWTGIVKNYLPVTLMALFMLVLSVMVVIYCIIVHFVYRKKMDILYLGIGLLVSSIWLIAESKLRQIFLPNSTIAADVGFFMVMLLPLPFLIYINNIQKRRYQKYYAIIGLLTVINFVGCTILQFIDIKDFSETMTSGHVIIVAMIVSVFISVIFDIKGKYINDYKEVSFGMAGLMMAGLYEIYMVYDQFSTYNGVGLCIGLVFLFFMAVIQTGRDLLQLENDKRIAIAANQSKSMFLANMSHEIRTPINTIVGMNEMILRENHDNDTKEYAKNIDNASKLLIGLIDDILDFSKLDAGKLEICENPYNVAVMLKDVLLGANVRMKDKELEMVLDIDDKLPTVLNGDEMRIKQIFNNLLSNAIKYTVEGRVIISLKGLKDDDGYSIQFSVSDTGVGIREEDIPTLFDSFRRMELKRNKYIQGTGLGLSITKQLVENMQGTINVDSKYGEGSTFTVSIPQGIIDDTPMGNFEEAYYNIASDVEEKEIIRFSSDKSVLVVDDNEMNLKVMGALLGKSGIKLDFATGGIQCVEKCKNIKYDLIFMDHMMPEPDGIETLHILKDDAEGMNRDTIVVVLTANAIKGASEQYEKEGFADYVTKPVEYSRIEEILVKYLTETNYEDEANPNSEIKNLIEPLVPEYILDKEEGIKYCGGMEDLYVEVLEHYIKNATAYKEELETAYEDKNWKEYARIAHTLKSNSLTIGLKDFSEIAKEHEFAGKADDEELITEKYEYFISCLDKSIEVAEQEIGKC